MAFFAVIFPRKIAHGGDLLFYWFDGQRFVVAHAKPAYMRPIALYFETKASMKGL